MRNPTGLDYKQNPRLSGSVRYANSSESVRSLNMQWHRSIPNENTKISRRRPRSVDDAELGHFTLFFLQRAAEKCTKISNARAQLLLIILLIELFVWRRSRYRRCRGLFKPPAVFLKRLRTVQIFITLICTVIVRYIRP